MPVPIIPPVVEDDPWTARRLYERARDLAYRRGDDEAEWLEHEASQTGDVIIDEPAEVVALDAPASMYRRFVYASMGRIRNA